MLYALFLEDDPDKAEARSRLMPDHLTFLEAHAREILAAGPLREADSGKAAGGLWLVEAESHERVEALLHADPFFPSGLRMSWRILAWTQVFADGKRCVPA